MELLSLSMSIDNCPQIFTVRQTLLIHQVHIDELVNCASHHELQRARINYTHDQASVHEMIIALLTRALLNRTSTQTNVSLFTY